MLIWTQIAVGVTVLVCITFLCYFCCRNRQHLRTRLTSVRQVSAIPEPEQLLHRQPKELIGIQRDVLKAFPTIKAKELQTGRQEENSQCAICLVEYEESDLLRQLPICGHIFHIVCVDSWLEKQPTCPVCRILLSSTAASTEACSSSFPTSSQYYRASSATVSTLTVKLAAASRVTPSWILVNQPLPLPRATPLFPSTTVTSSSSSSSSSGGACNRKASSSSPCAFPGGYSSSTSDLEARNKVRSHASLVEDSGENPLLKSAMDSGRELAAGLGSGCLLNCIVSFGGNNSEISQDDDRHELSCTASSSTGPATACDNVRMEKSRSVKFNHSVNNNSRRRTSSTESFSFEIPDSFNNTENHIGVLEMNQREETGAAAAAADQTMQTNRYTDLDSRAWPANMMKMPSRTFGSSSSKSVEEGVTVCCSPVESDSTIGDESRASDSRLPLTLSPVQCSFQFLPVVTTAPCSVDFSFKPTRTTTTTPH